MRLKMIILFAIITIISLSSIGCAQITKPTELFPERQDTSVEKRGEPVPGAEVYIELEGDMDPYSSTLKTNIGPISFGSKTGKNPLKTSTLIGKRVSDIPITVVLTETDTQVAQVTTDKNGEFSFEIVAVSQGRTVPPKIKVDLLIIQRPEFILAEDAINRITLELDKFPGPPYRFTLWWVTESAAQNRGSFAVSGKSDA